MANKVSISRRHLIAAGAILATSLSAAVKPRRAAAGWFNPMPCYLRGTGIRTPAGDREISKLSIGDLVVTHSGNAKPIKWIGRRRVEGWVEAAIPVMITSDALAPGVPYKNLFLSPGHAIYVDGLLIQSGSLVNGRTIVRLVAGESSILDYFQIELWDHDVVLAEGASAETYLESNDRESFDNWAEYEALYGREVATKVPFAPEIAISGRGTLLKSRLRSALAPWIDARNPFDVVRDRIEDRALALAATS